jgi:hypothetical protein
MMVAQERGRLDEGMKIIERKNLRVGYTISYSFPNTGRVSYGTIMHLGLGLAARNAVWVRCLDGSNTGKVEGILLEYVTGVTSYASR